MWPAGNMVFVMASEMMVPVGKCIVYGAIAVNNPLKGFISIWSQNWTHWWGQFFWFGNQLFGRRDSAEREREMGFAVVFETDRADTEGFAVVAEGRATDSNCPPWIFLKIIIYNNLIFLNIFIFFLNPHPKFLKNYGFWVYWLMEIRLLGDCLWLPKNTSHGGRWQLLVRLRVLGLARSLSLDLRNLSVRFY